MTNKNRNEINQPPTGEGEIRRLSLGRGDTNKLSKRNEVLKAGATRSNLDTAEVTRRAFGQANGRVGETLGWPIGY